MALQLQGSINPEARGQAAVELGVVEGSDLRLAALSRAGMHAGGKDGTLGLGSSSEVSAAPQGRTVWGSCYLGLCALDVLYIPVFNKVSW